MERLQAQLAMAHLVTASLGLLIYLSYSYCQTQAPTNAFSRLVTSSPTPNATSIAISSSITPSCNCSPNSTDRSTATTGFNLLLPLSISGVSAALGVAAVLLCLIVMAICNRRKRHTQGAHPAQKRATTSRKRSTRTARNGSKTIINKTHDYETVIPNFVNKPKGKEQQAQLYEVPLSKSMSLTRQHTDKNLESDGTWSLEESSESQRRKISSTRPQQEPIYMNMRTGESAQMCPESSMQCSIVNATHFGMYKNSNEAPGQEEDGGKNQLEASSQSWAI